MSRCLGVALGILGAAAQIASAQQTVATHPRVVEAVQLLDLWIEADQAYERIPGMSIALVFDQELLWSEGYGLADVERGIPATSTTLYSGCSIAKLFTATAVMQLVDQGRLRLDDPVSEHIPWFRPPDQFAEWGPITVEHLLTHSSGITRDLNSPYWTGPDYPFPSRDRLIGRFAQDWIRFPPGTRYAYSNLGMTLAGEIVSQLSGMTYEDYMRSRIFEPLGMGSSFTDQTEARSRAGMAVGYTLLRRDGTRAEIPPYRTRGLAPVAGLVSTVEDLARFASWQFRTLEGHDASLLKRNSLHAMHQVQWMPPDAWTTSGYGYQIWKENDRSFVGHAGTCPGYQSQLLLRPQDKVAVIAMINSQGMSPARYTQRAYDVLAPAVRAALNDPDPSASSPSAEVSPYLGHYQRPLGSERMVVPWQGRLAVLSLPTANPLSSLATFDRVEEGVFRRSGARPDLAEVIEFEVDATGQMRMWRGHQYWVRTR